MEQLLLELGLNVTSNAIYDFLKETFRKNPNVKKDELRDNLASYMQVTNAVIIAEKIITFLAKKGDILIDGSNIKAGSSVEMFSAPNTELKFGNGSISQTDKTKIEAGKESFIVARGGAGIKQDENGNISFMV